MNYNYIKKNLKFEYYKTYSIEIIEIIELLNNMD